MEENNTRVNAPTERKKSSEMFIGLNIINKIGVLFVIIGVIAFSGMSAEYIPDIVKTILIFALGGAMLIIGELMNRKKPDIFSHGITGGGTAVLYAAVAVGCFTMHTLNELLAFVLCFVLTAVVFMLANRYSSQTILALSLIGGFIPVFVLHASPSYIYGSMVYFLILNSIALAMSFYKNWTATSFICFFLNTIANVLIIFFSFEANGGFFNLSYSVIINPFILSTYIAVSHLICAAIPVIGVVRSKASISKKEIALVAMNAAASVLGLLLCFDLCRWDEYIGILFAALAIIYAGFAVAASRFFGAKSALSRMLGGFSAACALIFCAAQLSEEAVSCGITAVAALTLLIGIYLKDRFYGTIGAVMSVIAFAAMLYLSYTSFFWLSYLVFTVLLCFVVFTAIMRGYSGKPAAKVFKYIALINVWFYMLYAILAKLSAVAETTGNVFVCDYLVPSAAVAATFIAGFVFGRIKDTVFNALSLVLYELALLFYFGLQFVATPSSMELSGEWYAAMIAFSIVMNLISVLVVYDLAKTFNTLANGEGKLISLVTSAYVLISSTSTLSVFDSAAFTNWIISCAYIVMAFAWIWFGFRKSNVVMRRFGLGLALLASAKLFFIDLTSRSDIFGTISWFAFGIVLIGISYLYKLFGKALAEKENGAAVSSVDCANESFNANENPNVNAYENANVNTNINSSVETDGNEQ